MNYNMATFTFILLLAVVAVIAIPDFQYDLEKAEEYFEAFIQEYGKEYANEDVKARKFEVFKESLKAYNKMNMEQSHAKFGIHEHSDLTREELQKIRGGFRRMEGGFRRMTDSNCTSHTRAPAVNPPEAYDWQLQGSVVTPVKQQMCGDCYAFSATGNIEGQYAKKYGKLVELSEQQIVDCDKTNAGCHGGDMIKAIMEIKRVGGQMSLKDYPYNGIQGKCSFNASDIQAKVIGCETYNLTSEDDLVKVLYNRGPLAVGVDSTDLQAYLGGILRSCSFKTGNHGVLLVGYGVEDNIKFWRFKNSWGGFGEKGYIRVERGKNLCGLMSDQITSAIVA
ncbi:cathepsin L1-like [Hyposmocoma kahamanoa]|uniref:cathepsin L1-like n=1 Tax=Hyposmocoma kahamanoa TaxID=1477025 RepID=UPI000E6D96B9|nr:cathepsin L1-like [Hyposmocoma kahamanoa]